MANPGGWSTVKPVTAEVKKICIQEKPEMEKTTEMNFKDFIPILYMSQVVNGKSYLVKVDICQENAEEQDKCIHVKIFKALPSNGGKQHVTGFQYPKIISDPLLPF